ncbi:hypothetical protein GE300_14425 [Rhodobacteraceae bacterium 2CG4]|uniref:Uncharacterized protein n=1 Tax=Halovulum marinum TaxID=2662447 RepID=A0A6L5Z2K6_9RHOB|nr:hypothetical protein [Halovulum marinum]MSU90796.1 hypothetical protein [Halovulum marinum]
MQDPLSAPNPVYTAAFQPAEMCRGHLHRPGPRRLRTLEVLRKVGIPDTENRIGTGPHAFSGGGWTPAPWMLSRRMR